MKKTFGLCAAFVGVGLCVAIVGPTLSDLTAQVNRGGNFVSISFMFGGRSIGYLAGYFLSRLLYRIFNPQLIIALSLLLASIAMGIVSATHRLMSLFISMSVVGLTTSIIEKGAYVICLKFWGDRSSSFHQMIHFALAVGAFMAALLATPFPHWYSTYPCIEVSDNETTTNAPITTTSTPTKNAPPVEPDVPAMKVFIIISVYLGLISLLFFYFTWLSPTTSETTPTQPEKPSHESEGNSIFVVFFFHILYTASEVSFGAFASEVYLQSFYTVCSGTVAVVLFWGGFTAGRIIPLCFTVVTSSPMFLTAHVVGTLAASGILVLSVEIQPQSSSLFCLGTILLGLSMSNLYQTGNAWLQRYVSISEKHTTMLVKCDVLGHAGAPIILSIFIFPWHTYHALLYTMVTFSILWTSLVLYVYFRAVEAGIDPTPAIESSKPVVTNVIDEVSEALKKETKPNKTPKQITRPKFEVGRKHKD